MLACSGAWAQRVAYSYDSGGNRVSKRIIVVSNAKGMQGFFPDEEETTDVRSIQEDDGGISIIATDDNRVTVSISEGAWSGSMTVTMYGTDGRQVLSRQSNEQTTQVDMSSLPSGVYVLTVKTGRRMKTWRMTIQ